MDGLSAAGIPSRRVFVQGGLCSVGFCPGGFSVQGDICLGVILLVDLCPGAGASLSGRPPSPVDRQTDTCEIITLPQTSFAGGKNEYS